MMRVTPYKGVEQPSSGFSALDAERRELGVVNGKTRRPANSGTVRPECGQSEITRANRGNASSRAQAITSELDKESCDLERAHLI